MSKHRDTLYGVIKNISNRKSTNPLLWSAVLQDLGGLPPALKGKNKNTNEDSITLLSMILGFNNQCLNIMSAPPECISSKESENQALKIRCTNSGNMDLPFPSDLNQTKIKIPKGRRPLVLNGTTDHAKNAICKNGKVADEIDVKNY